MTFALFQIITILIVDFYYNLIYLFYVFVGLLTYIMVNKIVFHKFQTKNITNFSHYF